MEKTVGGVLKTGVKAGPVTFPYLGIGLAIAGLAVIAYASISK